ncbi:hypothetical protein A7981_05675 [Methylovorus sp. MM2]|uniref:hypothetical protein n=1 Tax=Methylovorus sp. MM2 TaxID=1848038 RepID=UPI0007E13C63|nr:hypothetical protein [Methylovorus sp. MM2]OAM52923.1 hypothetical protein A7981_05675 [Methylovorus sp. MM2]
MYEKLPKALRSVEHWACSAGYGDSPGAWIYPEALDLCGGGFVQQMQWKMVEPTQGSYNFSTVLSALNWMATNRPGLKVMLRLRDKSYSRTSSVFLDDTLRNLPDYFATLGYYDVYQSTVATGFGAKLWLPEVKDRYLALLEAMTASFGSHSAFGGIIFDECTLSMSYPAPAGFDPSITLANRKEVLLRAKALFQSKVIQPVNFLDTGDYSPTSFSAAEGNFVDWLGDSNINVSLVDTCPTTPSFSYSMHTALRKGLGFPVDAIIDAGRVYPRTDMSAGAELANVTENFRDITKWLKRYENIRRVFWPISTQNTLTALTAVLS